MQTREETGAALEELLTSPEERGDYDCTVPAGFAVEPGDELEARAQPIEAACSRQYTAVRQSGTRSLSQIALIVIHCTESSSARSSAQWFADPRAQGSAHLVLDDLECFRTLDNHVIPWGAKGANTRGFHIEIAGYAAWDRAEWMRHSEALRRAAYKAAVHAEKFGIPFRWLTPAQLKAGEKGFVTHAMCTQVFGGTHSDPGRQCPMEQLLAWTKESAERTPARPRVERGGRSETDA